MKPWLCSLNGVSNKRGLGGGGLVVDKNSDLWRVSPYSANIPGEADYVLVLLMGHGLAGPLGLCTRATWAQAAPITESFTFRRTLLLSDQWGDLSDSPTLPPPSIQLQAAEASAFCHHFSSSLFGCQKVRAVCFLHHSSQRRGRSLDTKDVTCFRCCDKHFKCELSDWSNTKAFMGSFSRLSGSLSRPCFHTNEFHHAWFVKEYSRRIPLVYKTQVD